MKKLIRSNTSVQNEEITSPSNLYSFTIENIIEFLSQITELHYHPIEAQETAEGFLEFCIGEGIYQIAVR